MVFDQENYKQRKVNGAHGDDVFLLATDASGMPFRFVDVVEFGAAAKHLETSFCRQAGASEWRNVKWSHYPPRAPHWGGAVEAARACGGADPWWCAALEGFALHGDGRYPHCRRA